MDTQMWVNVCAKVRQRLSTPSRQSRRYRRGNPSRFGTKPRCLLLWPIRVKMGYSLCCGFFIVFRLQFMEFCLSCFKCCATNETHVSKTGLRHSTMSNDMYVIVKTPNLMVNASANLFVRTAFSCLSLLSCCLGSAVADCIDIQRTIKTTVQYVDNINTYINVQTG